MRAYFEGHLRDLYLSLMERVLLGLINNDPPLDPWNGVLRDASGQIVTLEAGEGVVTMEAGPFNPDRRRVGGDWPATAHTMIGTERLHNWRMIMEYAIEQSIPGDFVECGVWRGGACILAAALLESYGKDQEARHVWVCDSFEGLPEPTHEADSKDWHHKVAPLSVSLEQVKANFDAYRLLLPHVKFLKGWFKDTLPSAPIEQIAALRVDGDMYQSTLDVLRALYRKVALGGHVIIDDYNAVRGCQRATDEFREQEGITSKLYPTDPYGVYWQKEG